MAWSQARFDEGTTVSTIAEGGAGAADSNAILYSTTARSNVAHRLVGRINFSLATAGTWNESGDVISLAPFTFDLPNARYTGCTSSVNGTPAVVKFKTISRDNKNAYSTSTGLYTVMEKGNYNWGGTIYVSFATGSTGQAGAQIFVYKNGVSFGRTFYDFAAIYAAGNVGPNAAIDSGLIPCDPGDTLSIYAQSDAGTPVLTDDATLTYGYFYRVS